MPNTKSKLVELNKIVPAFSCQCTPEQTVKPPDFKGQKVVLYFYPKDNTPGCTTEGQDFQTSLAKFKRANTIILGISRDPLSMHQKFKDKFNFKFELISDPNEELCKLFDVIKMKNMYGKKYVVLNEALF